MKTDIGLTEATRNSVAERLNSMLADEYILYTKTRNYHWNVTGPQFSELHQFFKEQYEALNDVVDEVAERVRTVGGWPYGTVSEFLKHARLKEQPGRVANPKAMLANLLADHEAIVRQLRVDAATLLEEDRDAGTSDFVTAVMEKHEKMAWMLRAHLEGE